MTSIRNNRTHEYVPVIVESAWRKENLAAVMGALALTCYNPNGCKYPAACKELTKCLGVGTED